MPVPDALVVALDVTLAGDGEFDGVFDGVAPFESVADGVEVALAVVLGVVECDVDVDGVGELVSELVPVGVRVAGGVDVALFEQLRVLDAVPELLPVVLGEAPLDRVGVIVALIVLLTETVELDVIEDVHEPVGDELDVGVMLGDELAVGDDESVVVDDVDTVLVGVAEILGVAPGESDGVGAALTVVEALTVVDPLSLPLGVPLPVDVGVTVPDDVQDCVGGGVPLALIVVLPVPVSLPVLLGLAPTVRLAVGVRDTERERLAVVLGVSADVGVGDAVREAVGVPLTD